MFNGSECQPRRIFGNGRATFHHYKREGWAMLCRILPSRRNDSRANDAATAGKRFRRSNQSCCAKKEDQGLNVILIEDQPAPFVTGVPEPERHRSRGGDGTDQSSTSPGTKTNPVRQR